MNLTAEKAIGRIQKKLPVRRAPWAGAAPRVLILLIAIPISVRALESIVSVTPTGNKLRLTPLL